MRFLIPLILALLLPLAASANGSVHHNTTNIDNSKTTTKNSSSANSSSSATVDSHDVYRGDDYESAASSATLYLEGCNQGAAAQGVGFGAALGGESRVCRLLRVAAALQAAAAGHREAGMLFEAARLERQAQELVQEAVAEVREDAPLARAGRWLDRNVLDPIWRRLPWIGDSA